MSGETHHRVEISGVSFDALDEASLVVHILSCLAGGRGGWLVNPNVDVLRKIHNDREVRDLVRTADLIVADGAPVLWAAKLSGTPLPARVPGATFLWTMSGKAAEAGRSVFLLGGATGVAERAAEKLRLRFPHLNICGVHCPPVGFEHDQEQLSSLRRRLTEVQPDLVFCGLGFPKQEFLMSDLHEGMPATWFIGSGASLTFAAGDVRRAPAWMQRWGLEWLHRLASEPRRLARRYLVDDLPFFLRLLAAAAISRRRGHAEADRHVGPAEPHDREARLAATAGRASGKEIMPTKSREPDYFERTHHGSFWRARGDQPLLFRRRAQTLARLSPSGGRLLDVGSGEGFFAAAAMRAGFEVTGLDFLEEGVRRTADRIGRRRVLRGSAMELPFSDSSFDVVTAWDVLEHLERPGEALAEFRRVLRCNGALAASTPNPEALSVRRRGQDSIQFQDPTHVSILGAGEWTELLTAQGFRLERLGGDGWWNPPYRPSWIPRQLWIAGSQLMFATRFAWPVDSAENTVLLARADAVSTEG